MTRYSFMAGDDDRGDRSKRRRTVSSSSSSPSPPPGLRLGTARSTREPESSRRSDTTLGVDLDFNETVEEEEEDEDEYEAEEDEEEEEEEEQEEEEVQAQAEPVGDNLRSGGVYLSDSDVLECPICVEPLVPPVYQCENGHLACHMCCRKIRNKCPSCTMPIGYNRCRGMEKVLEAAKIHCPNSSHGCRELISFCKKLDHERTCIYVPCSCPHTGCDYSGRSTLLHIHFAVRHSHTARKFCIGDIIQIELRREDDHVVLLETRDQLVFIINWTIIPLGTLVNVICLAPNSCIKYAYEVTAKRGNKLIMLKSCAEFAQKFSAASPKNNCLLITSDFAREGVISLDVSIQEEKLFD